jgi:hypothetical protein
LNSHVIRLTASVGLYGQYRTTRHAVTPSRRSAPLRTKGADGETAGETLVERLARLEALMESVTQKLDAQLRRTGEIQVQLDRAISDRPLK